MKKNAIFTALAVLAAAAPVAAQDSHPSGVTIGGPITQTSTSNNDFNGTLTLFDGRMCIGNACDDTTVGSPGTGPLRLRWSQADLVFEDSSSSSFPDRDWRILINDSAPGGLERFSIMDDTSGGIPFTVVGAAPQDALFMAADGDIGLGTAVPSAELHVLTDEAVANLILEETLNTDGGVELKASSSLFSVTSLNHGTVPFFVLHQAPTGSFRMAANGDIGLGTAAPDGKLHTKGDGVQLAYFESGDGGPVQVRFRTDSENRRFLATNNADEVKTQIIFGDDEIKFTGATDSGANLWLTIGPSGILSQGSTCNATPCDRTFDPEFFTVPPIKERAAYMWDNMHLPAVGPTKAGELINLTAKTTGMLHELEVAHIYIEQLHNQIAEERATTTARFEEQETKVQRQTDRLDSLQAMIDLQQTELKAIKAMLAEH